MILVAGGTGRLGSVVVRRLLASQQAVRVLTRDAARASSLGPDVDVAIGDVRDPRAVADAVIGTDLIISAMHGFIGPRGVTPASVDRDGNAHLIDAAERVGAGMILMSIVGASSDSPMELFRMKQAAEEHLQRSAIPSTVVAATSFTELWVELLEQTAAKSGRPLVFGRGENPINFVGVDDVAWLVERAAVDAGLRGRTLSIGGPEDLTFDELASRIQVAAGRGGAARHIPRAVLRAMAGPAGLVSPVIGRQLRAAHAMDTVDLTFDAAPLHIEFPDLPTTTVDDVLARRYAPPGQPV